LWRQRPWSTDKCIYVLLQLIHGGRSNDGASCEWAVANEA
jgi:hypothetical protein